MPTYKSACGAVVEALRRTQGAVSMQAVQVLKKLFDDYRQTTPGKLKIIDAYMLYILLTGIAQFVYCLLVGTFPFNSFLSGFISTVTSFVLASCLRTQVNDENKSDFSHISPERAFADFIFAHVILHLVVANFLG
ncbi:Dolichyl-diphosphooligosaccharide-protein glycosyltransferase subunit dad1 [Parelaphostrongylus tenuis]|uniref:Dolichyl-diphosphooligosaccharide--protein glycosyltransferase subunit DAD1 n=1 Tax=Parelaphostrongylus tenuis TaxID=148309 RepID=A0AAD5R2F7_PARTN|nr:Dolichyl-diphosphooligosaccharide-protein glycosyltransferase subunit dad1 [Parelaphostrongylus tenuis]